MDERVFRRSPFVFAAKRALAYATRKEVTFFYVSPPPSFHARRAAKKRNERSFRVYFYFRRRLARVRWRRAFYRHSRARPAQITPDGRRNVYYTRPGRGIITKMPKTKYRHRCGSFVRADGSNVIRVDERFLSFNIFTIYSADRATRVWWCTNVFTLREGQTRKMKTAAVSIRARRIRVIVTSDLPPNSEYRRRLSAAKVVTARRGPV